MAWASYSDGNGQGWAVDIEGAAHVFRSAFYNRQLVQRSRMVQRNHGMFMPITTELETNFTGIREATATDARAYIDQLRPALMQSPRALYEFLVRAREDGEAAGAHYRRLSRQASQASARAIGANVDNWENAIEATKFVRDASAGAFFIGATTLTGGAAAVALGAGTGLTFVANTEDNMESGQTMRTALRNATVSTSISLVTNVLIPKGLSGVARGMVTGAERLTMGQNVALGLVSAQANIAADLIKTALTADPVTTEEGRRKAELSIRAQLRTRSGAELASMLFGAWLSARGIPASAVLRNSADAVNSAVGASLSSLGDRLVAAAVRNANPSPGNLDLVFAQLARTASAEDTVREIAMRPA